jgi:hypothetical protein
MTLDDGRFSWGLIAEEVAEVYPGPVVRSSDGQIEMVPSEAQAP